MKARVFLILGVLLASTARLALADDGPDGSAKAAAVSAPTAAEFLPMTRSERLRNYLAGLANGESIVRAAASAAVRQAENSPKEWQGGGKGYGYRIGDAFAQHVIRNTLQYGASSVLHEDNRYFASGQSGVFRRMKYAVSSAFLARRDNGDRTFAFSRVGSAAGAAFISRIWQPPSTTTAGDGAVSFGIAMGSDIGFNMVREFLPGLKGHLHKR
jgi:hypothetical protein